jgi:plasmid replication initiation protein
MMRKDIESERAAAELYRLAQATALLRLYRDHEGREAQTCEEVSEWAQQHPEVSREQTDADFDAVSRRYPHLVAIANRSNPHLSEEN